MLPMRSIPFRVICLVGMNHDAYPRRSRSVGFDLMAQHPRPGDRSRRNDDRYLFLEALLSARKTFYMSYVGQSLRDNSPIPPSVLVSELMDYVGADFDTGGVPVRERLVTRHRLQAFSPAYFQQGRLFTYARENLEAALALTDTGREPTPFISSPLPDPDPAFRSLDVEDMIRFFVNPCRFLLMRRLGIQLHERSDILEEREAFRTKGLERYLLASHLLGHKLHGRDLTTLFAPARASGGLPHGTVGKREFEALRHGVEVFAHQINTHVSDAPLPPVEVDLPLSGFRLYGRLSAIYPEGLLRYRYARVKARDRLRVWIYHLVLNSLPAHGYPRDSLLAGLDPAPGPAPGWAAWHYPPIANSREILLDLLEKYWAGLTRPLRFFPASSWAYASAREKDKSPGESLGRALREWEGSPRTPGEGEDAAYRICFGEAHPLDELFQTTAEAVFAPVVEHEREITR
jgi:exodeoxyribonuclease V gamma subunit